MALLPLLARELCESPAALVSFGQQRRLPWQVPPLVEIHLELVYAALPVAAGELFA
jgi:hypothetical protein